MERKFRVEHSSEPFGFSVGTCIEAPLKIGISKV